METNIKHKEQPAETAFSVQSSIFDEIYAHNTIVQYKRERVRTHVLQYLNPNSYILELNSGTGEDAIFFAKLGYKVHAIDISLGMQTQLRRKRDSENLQNLITNELCSYTELHQLKNKGPFDYIFSNFAGLNCTDELDKVLHSFNDLLNPGGKVTLVILPKFCLWEFLLLFIGKFKTAFRRLFSFNGTNAHIEGTYFKCWYYNPSYIIKNLQNDFKLLHTEGLCTLVPPSYIEHFAEKHAKKYRILKNLEDRLKSQWPWKYIGDYYIISLQKR